MEEEAGYTILYYLETKNIIILFLFFFLIYWFLYRNSNPNTSSHRDASRRSSRRRFSPFNLRHYKTVSQSEVSELNSPSNSTKRKRTIRKRDRFIGVMKRILSVNDVQPASIPSSPPQEYFDPSEDMSYDNPQTPLPHEVILLLKNLQIFGHYEKPMFIEFCKSVETQFVPAGAWLFRPGNKEDCIFVVQRGKLGIHVLENQQDLLISEVDEGHPVYSLLSLTAELIGFPQVYKTIAAQAMTDSTVIKLKVEHFKNYLEQNPDTFLRILQVLAINLMRINFLALHKYLDLQSVLLQDYKVPGDQAETPPSTPRRDSLMSPRKSRPSVRFSMEEEKGTDFDTFLHQAKLSPSSILEMPSITIDEYSIEGEENASAIEKEEAKALEKAREKLAEIFQLQDPSCLNKMTQLICMPKGTIVYSEGDLKDFVYYVYSGKLVTTSRNPEGTPVSLYYVHPGEIEGSLPVLTGEPSVFTLTTLTDVQLILISKPQLFILFKEEPHVILPMASSIVNRLSPFMRQIDFALNWIPLDAGVVLYKQDDPSTSAHIVLSGRLRSFTTNEKGSKELIEEFGRGDTVGMVEVVTKSPYATTVYAIRDTHLVSLPTGLLNWIKVKAPQVVYRLIQLLGEKVLGSYKKTHAINKLPSTDLNSFIGNKNVSTVAIIGANPSVPVARFCEWLLSATNKFAHSRLLSSYSVQQEFGQSLMKIANDYRLITWLERQEEDNELLLYQADPKLTAWTRRCLRQADCILIVDTAENGPSIGPIIKQLNTSQNLVQRALVLLHRESTVMPKGTAMWLKEVGYCSGRFHIRCPDVLFTEINRYEGSETDDDESITLPVSPRSDISRLARWLTGNSVGLVLGGGGARGGAHVGVLKALAESEIPVDIIGGTSMGACIGAIICQARDHKQVEEMACNLFKAMASPWRQILDITIPFTSMLTGAHFNNVLRNVLGDHMIEDLWIPFFCVSTDLTENRMRVHQNGPLWPYVRASMTLAGYFPPICEPQEGNLLVDGGYLNNLPADVAKVLGAKTVLSVDVSGEVVSDFSNYGYHLNGWWVMWKKWVPFTGKVNIPSMGEIQRALAYVASVQQLDEVKASDYEYIRPALGKFGLLQFSSYKDITDIGYEKVKSLAESWKKNPQLMRSLFSISTCDEPQHGKKIYSTPHPKPGKQESFSRLRSLSNLAALAATNVPHAPLTADHTGYWSSPDATLCVENATIHKCSSEPNLISDSENNTSSDLTSHATSTEEINQAN